MKQTNEQRFLRYLEKHPGWNDAGSVAKILGIPKIRLTRYASYNSELIEVKIDNRGNVNVASAYRLNTMSKVGGE